MGDGVRKATIIYVFLLGKKKYKIVAENQVETLIFLNFIPALPGSLNVLIQAFYFIYLSAK